MYFNLVYTIFQKSVCFQKVRAAIEFIFSLYFFFFFSSLCIFVREISELHLYCVWSLLFWFLVNFLNLISSKIFTFQWNGQTISNETKFLAMPVVTLQTWNIATSTRKFHITQPFSACSSTLALKLRAHVIEGIPSACMKFRSSRLKITQWREKNWW